MLDRIRDGAAPRPRAPHVIDAERDAADERLVSRRLDTIDLLLRFFRRRDEVADAEELLAHLFIGAVPFPVTRMEVVVDAAFRVALHALLARYTNLLLDLVAVPAVGLDELDQLELPLRALVGVVARRQSGLLLRLSVESLLEEPSDVFSSFISVRIRHS